MIPANLIINADDFGLEERFSGAIAQCLDEGLINSFSVYPFADAPHGDLLRDVAARHPGARIGAHLAVTGPDLPDHPGHFRDVLARYLSGRLSAERVRGMWKDQIRDLQHRLGGRNLDHLDSHQHLHLLPGLWEAARSLQQEFRIPRLRVPYEGLARALGHRFPFGAALQGLARLRAGSGKPAFVGFFTSTAFTLAANRPGLDRVRREPDRVFELMVHPALPQAGVPAGAREREIEELRALARWFAINRSASR